MLQRKLRDTWRQGGRGWFAVFIDDRIPVEKQIMKSGRVRVRSGQLTFRRGSICSAGPDQAQT